MAKPTSPRLSEEATRLFHIAPSARVGAGCKPEKAREIGKQKRTWRRPDRRRHRRLVGEAHRYSRVNNHVDARGLGAKRQSPKSGLPSGKMRDCLACGDAKAPLSGTHGECVPPLAVGFAFPFPSGASPPRRIRPRPAFRLWEGCTQTGLAGTCGRPRCRQRRHSSRCHTTEAPLCRKASRWRAPESTRGLPCGFHEADVSHLRLTRLFDE